MISYVYADVLVAALPSAVHPWSPELRIMAPLTHPGSGFLRGAPGDEAPDAIVPGGSDSSLLCSFEPFDLPATIELNLIEFLSPFPSEQRG